MMPTDCLAAPEDRIHILFRSRDRLQVVGVNQKTDNGFCHKCRKGWTEIDVFDTECKQS